MNIVLYKNTDDPRRVIKNLEVDKITISADFYNEKDIVSPVILTHNKSTVINGYTYAYIADYKRYYFVNNPTAYKGDSCILFLNCDVLTTAYYEYDLDDKQACIIRSGKKGINNIIDKSLPIDPNAHDYIAINIGNSPVTDITGFIEPTVIIHTV